MCDNSDSDFEDEMDGDGGRGDENGHREILDVLEGKRRDSWSNDVADEDSNFVTTRRRSASNPVQPSNISSLNSVTNAHRPPSPFSDIGIADSYKEMRNNTEDIDGSRKEIVRAFSSLDTLKSLSPENETLVPVPVAPVSTRRNSPGSQLGYEIGNGVVFFPDPLDRSEEEGDEVESTGQGAANTSKCNSKIEKEIPASPSAAAAASPPSPSPSQAAIILLAAKSMNEKQLTSQRKSHIRLRFEDADDKGE